MDEDGVLAAQECVCKGNLKASVSAGFCKVIKKILTFYKYRKGVGSRKYKNISD
jgi:hypothetical protein